MKAERPDLRVCLPCMAADTAAQTLAAGYPPADVVGGHMLAAMAIAEVGRHSEAKASLCGMHRAALETITRTLRECFTQAAVGDA